MEETAQATPAVKAKAPRAAAPKSLEDYQDRLDKLLASAAKDGWSPQRLLAHASAKSGMGLVERFTDVLFDALEGRKKK